MSAQQQGVQPDIPAPGLQTASPVGRADSRRYAPYYGLFGNQQDERVALLLDALADVDAGRSAKGDTHFNPKYWEKTAGTNNSTGLKQEAHAFLEEIKGVLEQPASPIMVAVFNNVFANTAPVDSELIASLKNTIKTMYGLDSGVAQGTLVPAVSGSFAAILAKLFDSKDSAANETNYGKSTRRAGRFTTYRIDKYTLTQFLEAREAYYKGLVSPEAPAEAQSAPENVYFRKVGQTDKLYTLDSDGNEVEVQKGSPAFQSLTSGPNCYGTGVVDVNNGPTCNDYFTQCLAGNSVQKCLDFMAADDFWANAMSAVNSTNPEILLATLDNFGFKPFETKTTTGQSYKAYPSATEWLAALKESLQSDATAMATLNGIKANSKLMGYLDAVVTKINSNPGVANPTYVEGKVAFNDRAFEGSLLSTYGIKPKAMKSMTVVAKPAPTPSAVTALQNTVVNYMTPLGLFYNIMPFGVGFQSGGADVWELDVTNDKQLPLQVGGQLNEMYESVIENLQSVGKDLDAGDQQTIKKLVNELISLEAKLFKSAAYADGFNSLLSITQSGGGLVNEESYQKFVSKRNDYFNRVNSKYQVIFPIFTKLAEACAKETTSASDVITAKHYPVE